MSKKGLGMSMAFFGGATIALPLLGLQFRLMNWAGSGYLAIGLIVLGLGMTIFGK